MTRLARLSYFFPAHNEEANLAALVGEALEVLPTLAETFEIRCGSRSVTHRNATTPQHAVIDYLRSLGSRDAEIVRLAPGGVSWRGAVYTAVPLAGSARADAVPSESGRG